ncbi:hypothetical protein [Nonomuraea sp. NPDC049750]|uniref:hypothetical protein n=1 Tax=Nonomuraea sp. NPDC049750 TaxID=3154738 RepID=UPI0033C4C380
MAFEAPAGLVRRKFEGRGGSVQSALAEADPENEAGVATLRQELAQAAAEDPVHSGTAFGVHGRTEP